MGARLQREVESRVFKSPHQGNPDWISGCMRFGLNVIFLISLQKPPTTSFKNILKVGKAEQVFRHRTDGKLLIILHVFF